MSPDRGSTAMSDHCDRGGGCRTGSGSRCVLVADRRHTWAVLPNEFTASAARYRPSLTNDSTAPPSLTTCQERPPSAVKARLPLASSQPLSLDEKASVPAVFSARGSCDPVVRHTRPPSVETTSQAGNASEPAPPGPMKQLISDWVTPMAVVRLRTSNAAR